MMPRPPAGEGSTATTAMADGRRSVPPIADVEQPAFTPAHTDWLHQRLQVSGPVLELSAFRKAAAGAGIIP